MKKNTYTKSDLVKKVSLNNNLSMYESKVMVECVLESFSDYLKRDEESFRIEIRNFGVFEVKPTKGRKNIMNPKTKKLYDVPPAKKVLFRPSKSVKKHLRKTRK